jgi:hypothetical protein
LPLRNWIAEIFVWRILRHLERRFLTEKVKIPFESEVTVNKQFNNRKSDPVHFIVVYNNLEVLNDCFLKSNGLKHVSLIQNVVGESLPKIFNKAILGLINNDCWIVFCHQDLILNSDLRLILTGKDANAVYGAIGAHVRNKNLFGRIRQLDDSFLGHLLLNVEPVQTVDELCLIVHSSLFREGLRFDERFQFDFYSADLCMTAFCLGFNVYALQVDCIHKSKSLTGDLNSSFYLKAKSHFRSKWSSFLPVKTSTCILEAK